MITVKYQRLLLVYLIVFLFSSDMEGKQQHVATGRVIASDAYIGLARMSSVTNVSIFILKVENASGRTGSSRFVKVRYEDYAGRKPLPADLLQGKSSWRFSLRRNRSCDQMVTEGLIVAQEDSKELPHPDTFILVPSADRTDLPPVNSTLPCFVLKPGGARPRSGSR